MNYRTREYPHRQAEGHYAIERLHTL